MEVVFNLDIKPDFYEAWNNRGIALEKLRKLEEAAKSYAKALEIQPNYLRALSNDI